MGNCLALPVMHSYGYIDATHRYYKAEASNVWALISCARLLPGCRMEDIPGYRE